MYLRRVYLENVRGIKKLDFEFPQIDGSLAGWHVITGDNASGKTTFLKSVALALVGPDRARTLQPSFDSWVSQGEMENLISVEITAGTSDGFIQGRKYERPFRAELKCVKTDEGSHSPTTLGVAKRFRGKDRGPTHGPWADNSRVWFSAGYGPFRRLYGASPDAVRVSSGPPTIARYATMFREDAALGECEIWLQDLKHRELEGRTKEKMILQQVVELLNDDFLRNGLAVDRVDSDGLWLKQDSGVTLPLSAMSEGYRAALALLIDLLRHFTLAYGNEGLVERDTENNMVVPHEGVVLIDEVDSHLHPEWQRKIGSWLTSRFPKVQFLVSTHSAFICQNADVGGIFHLPSVGSEMEPYRLSEDDCQKIRKGTADQVFMTPAFGMDYVRSPIAVQKRGRFAQLRAKEIAGELSASEKQEKQKLLPWTDNLDGVST